jgi:hypothetical protein
VTVGSGSPLQSRVHRSPFACDAAIVAFRAAASTVRSAGGRDAGPEEEEEQANARST